MTRSEIRETVDALAAVFGSSSFTSSQAEAVGILSHRIARAVRSGEVLRLWRGHYVLPLVTRDLRIPGLSELQSAQVREAVDRLAGGPICLGDATASEVWGSPLLDVPQPAFPVLYVHRESGVRSGVQWGLRFVHRVVDPERIVPGPGGIPVSDPLLTAIHVSAARDLGLAQRLVALHGGMRRYVEWQAASAAASDLREASTLRRSAHDITRVLDDRLIRERLVEEAMAVTRAADLRGKQRVIDTLALVDPRLETALESISWAAFVEARIDLPAPQVSLLGSSGARWRVDFLFSDRVIGECDGAVKYSDPQALWKEKKRQEDLEQAGYIVVRWTWEEIVYRPWVVVRRILEAIGRSRRLQTPA